MELSPTSRNTPDKSFLNIIIGPGGPACCRCNRRLLSFTNPEVGEESDLILIVSTDYAYHLGMQSREESGSRGTLRQTTPCLKKWWTS